MLHRQWLMVRRAGRPRTGLQRRVVRCLRDTALLLHSLSRDKLFTVHGVEVLHQYDQVMPGVSMLIRGLPDVTDCEGEPAEGSPPPPMRGSPEPSWPHAASHSRGQLFSLSMWDTVPPSVSQPGKAVVLTPCWNCHGVTQLAVAGGARPGWGGYWSALQA